MLQGDSGNEADEGGRDEKKARKGGLMNDGGQAHEARGSMQRSRLEEYKHSQVAEMTEELIREWTQKISNGQQKKETGNEVR